MEGRLNSRKDGYLKSKRLLAIICILAISNMYLLHNKDKNEQQIHTQQKKIEKEQTISKMLYKEIDKKNIQIKNIESINNEKNKKIKNLENDVRSLKDKNTQLKKAKLSRGGDVLGSEEMFEITFYTSLNCENSKYGAVTCNGNKLRDGMVANNVLPQGTKIKLQGYGVVEVLDRGGSDFDDKYRLDVFISKNKGESDYEYLRRVNNMGRMRVKGYIIK